MFSSSLFVLLLITSSLSIFKCNGSKISNQSNRIKRRSDCVKTNYMSCSVPKIEHGAFHCPIAQAQYTPGDPPQNFPVRAYCTNETYILNTTYDTVYCVTGKFEKYLPKCVLACPVRVYHYSVEVQCKFNGVAQNCSRKVPVGTIATMKCKPNYVELNPGPSTSKCLGGFWDEPQKECISFFTCPAKISTNSVEVKCELNGVEQDCSRTVPEGTIATMKCKPNFVELDPGPLTATCFGGSWDKPQKQCLMTCPVINSTSVDVYCTLGGKWLDCSKKVPVGTIATIKCKPNYVELNPGASTSTCVHGSWNKPQKQCLMSCPVINSTSVDVHCTLDGKWLDCSKKVPVGTIATMKCKPNYVELNPGASTSTCLGGFWDKPQKQCLMTCPAINSTSVDANCILYGKRWDCSKNVPVGTIATMKCKPNYVELNPGPSTSKCLGGFWDEPQKECLMTCPVIHSTSVDVHCTLGGKWLDCSKKVPVGTIATMKCKPNYVELNPGPSTSTCVRGSWDKPQKQCLMTCPAINSSSVDVHCTLDGKWWDCSKKVPVGTIATMKCKPNYVELNPGSSTSKCLGGSWDKPQKQCLMTCSAIQSTSVDVNCILGGKQWDCSKKVPVGTIATMKCKPNYVEINPGASTSTCLGGSWDKPQKQCLRTCPAIHSTSVDVNCILGGKRWDCSKNVPVGTIATMKCKPNYVELNPGASTSTCVHGSWDKPQKQCLMTCPAINSTSVDVHCTLNGKWLDCSKKVPVGTIATMKCKPNYVELNPGTSTSTCLGGSWDKPQKQCLMTCPAINSTSVDVNCILYGKRRDCSKRVPVGTIATMKCKPNYVELNPGPSTSTCLSGSWDKPQKQCLMTCPAINSTSVDVNCILYGKRWDCSKRVPVGTIATMKCKPNYAELNPGTSTSTCLGGSWDKPQKQCLMTCPALNSTSVDVNCILYGKRWDCSKRVPVGTIATMKCKPNYVELNPGPSTSTCLGGSWDKPQKQCLMTCPAINSFSVDVNCILYGKPWDCSKRVPVGTIATMKCKPNFVDIDPFPLTAICLNGYWDIPQKHCLKPHVYSRCELVEELLSQGLPRYQLERWVCVVETVSNRNTAALTRYYSHNSYGLYQINGLYWCKVGSPGGGCNIDCKKFLDDDITDDTECAKIIYDNEGFNAWFGRTDDCPGFLPDLSQCGY